MNTPTRGIYSGNDLDWDGMPTDDVDPAFGRVCPFCGSDWGTYPGMDYDSPHTCADCGEDVDGDSYDGGDAPERLIGDWVYNAKIEKWEIDQHGPEGFAAVYWGNGNTLGVEFSQTVRYGRPASPCYPGQVDAMADDKETPTGLAVALPYYALPAHCLHIDE